MYFGGDDERAAEAMAGAPPGRRPVWAITGYFLAHFLMIFGILMVAAGTHLAVHDLLGRTPIAGAWLIACGAGLFGVGSAAFRQALRFAPAVVRTLGGVACLVAVPVGRYGSAAAELAVVALVLGLTVLADGWLARRGPSGDGPGAAAVTASAKMTA
jgi:low temperature requirement protein LtrA